VTRRGIATGLIVLVVVLCAWPLAVFSMKHYLPEVDNDEVMYFLLVKVFRSQGFHGGYSFVNDRIPVSPVHFDMHGPGIVLLYSQLARLVGWTNYSPYLANVLMFASSWLLLAYALRRRPENQIAVAGFVLANGYFFMFLPSAMQESFHLGVAMAAAGLWCIAVDRDSTAAWIGLGVLLAVAIVVRYSWAIVVPVAVFSFVSQRMDTRRPLARVFISAAVAAAVGAVVTVGAIKLLLWWAAPPATVVSGGFSLPRLAEGFHASRVQANLSTLLHFRLRGSFADYSTYFVASLAITLAAFAAVVFRARAERTRAAALYAAVILAASAGAHLLFSEVDGYRELRLVAPAHALAGLVFLSLADLRVEAWSAGALEVVTGVVLVVVVVNAMFTHEGLEHKYWYNWTQQAPGIDEHGRMAFAAFGPQFEFHPDDSSFCKTVYGDSEVLADPRLIHLPDGFALSVVEPDHEQLPRVHGKYALAKAPGPDLHPLFDFGGAFSRSSEWRKIAAFEDLTLFRSTVNCLP
jgi:Dolichyl-phosphate-mannose-protein mannosyltransferase